MANVHISISAEPLFHVGPLTVTNSIFTSLIVSALIIIFALYANTKIKPTKRPQGLQNFLELFIGGLYDFVNDITHNTTKTRAIFPLFASFFIFIMLNNWFGLVPGVGTIGLTQEPASATHASLIPGAHAQDAEVHVEEDIHLHEDLPVEGDHVTPVDATTEAHEATFIPILRAGTADLNTTLALAIISVFATQVVAVKFLGFNYFSKFFNLNGIFSFVGILEFISEISKIISFAFRLFGNIFAGEVLLAVIAFLVPIVAPMPFIGLEIFVGFIQALVFALLTLVFTAMATESHAEAH